MSEQEKCGCGCDHEHDHEDFELETMFLTLDDDKEVECGILGVFDVEGKEYIALLPLEDETVFLYAYSEVDDEIQLDVIEDDATFEKVSNAFYELYDEEEEE